MLAGNWGEFVYGQLLSTIWNHETKGLQLLRFQPGCWTSVTMAGGSRISPKTWSCTSVTSASMSSTCQARPSSTESDTMNRVCTSCHGRGNPNSGLLWRACVFFWCVCVCLSVCVCVSVRPRVCVGGRSSWIIILIDCLEHLSAFRWCIPYNTTSM